MKALKAAQAKMLVIVAETRVCTALTHDLPLEFDWYHKARKTVLLQFKSKNQYVGPHVIAQIDDWK